MNNSLTNKRKTRYERFLDGGMKLISFYRENPHRMALEYLNMTWMKPFQQLLLLVILKFIYVMIIASRGMGKSMLVAAAICVKSILYPGEIITIASGNRGQSVNVLEKIINQFCPQSSNLRKEIVSYSVSPQNAYIKWRNGSFTEVVTAGQGSRSARTNWLIADEFVQVKKSILDSVLKKFKAGQRNPEFCSKPEYKDYPKEPNCETYISSAYYKWHYAWDKFKTFFKAMVKSDDEKYFCCALPYQLPVSEGYYPLEQVQDEMQEADFDPIAWSMEMESLFWGESANAFFSYQDADRVRSIMSPTYPRPYYALLPDNKFKLTAKRNGEIRIIGMDVATAGGSKNDATSICLLEMHPTSGMAYNRSITYLETLDGGHGQAQAVRVRQLFDDFDADYIVIDTNGRNAPFYGDIGGVARKKTGTLRWEPEWKAVG